MCEDPMPHASRKSPSCFGFLYFPDHVQPLQGGHVTKHWSSPVHRSSPTDLSTHTPYTLHPTPYTLHPTPYTLHPTPCTHHPTP